MGYAELQVTSNFSFLRGASHPEELVKQAAAYNYSAIAITDRNTLAGVVRAHVEAKAREIKFITACRLDLLDGASLLAYPTDKAAYGRLCSLLTKGNFRTEKGKCDLYKADVYEARKGIKFIVIPPSSINKDHDFDPAFKKDLGEYREVFGKDLYMAATQSYQGDDHKKLFRLSQLGSDFDILLIATNDVHYHYPARRQLQDVLTCIREKCTIQNAGFLLHKNSERYLKPIDEMLRLFNHYPDAIKRTQEFSEACQFTLDSLNYTTPDELADDGRTLQDKLTAITWQCAKEKYAGNIPEKIISNINHELRFIEQMNYAYFFLQVYDFVCFAKQQNILFQGRGSAANSSVCYCLGITSVNPEKFELLFERFISAERHEPPDIDVDFEHERREEVMQYIFNKYGRLRAAIVATVTQQHQKGSVRDVAKAMGFSLDAVNRLSASISGFGDEWFDKQKLTENGFNANDKLLRKVLELTAQYIGFPRQLGQHTGGFVITQEDLSGICPIINARMENRTNIEWNKDDIDALGFPKVDVLALGMLTCIRKAFELAKKHYDLSLTLANVPNDDPAVYEMICHADTIGVFQIESRAQQAMLPRLKPKSFYDLVIEVAIVRPGPIQGDMVHPYLKRRNGEVPVEYPSKELEAILGRTLGVPLFQEQAMKIAIVAAGFTPTEADALRKSMATFKAQGLISKFEQKLIAGMIKNGYTEEYAHRVFRQLEGFGSYGFPESHAASFAHLVYISSWIKCHYPDIFACALLNSQPMGFYQPAQIVADARNHNVEMREIDINYSAWDNLLEEKVNKYHALRLGFRQVKGINKEEIEFLLSHRKEFFTSIQQLRDIGLSSSTLETLADADAFRSIGLDRRQALWQVSASHDQPTGIFRGQQFNIEDEKKVLLPEMMLSEHVVHDYASTSLSLKAHPVSFIREKLHLLHIKSTLELSQLRDGDTVKVSGLVLVRQRPGTAKGICFITIEDETGTANLVVFPNIFQDFRKEVLQSRLLMVEGKLQIEGEVIHVIVNACYDLSKLLQHLTISKNEDIPVLTLSRADQTPPTSYPNQKRSQQKIIQKEIFSKGRNFK
ncbi:MAG TPA: error-prone DNA polymerase [Chitinophagaceae bacterium]|nr:error-prone DNA polymerase [Chitinophagaceae bacterium]